MATSDGWYVIGPLLAVTLAATLGVMFWRIGMDWIEQADDPFRETYGLAIFAEPEDYGLLCAAAITDEPADAEDLRRLLAEAGIRCTLAVRDDGRVAVLVFGEELEAARRLVR